MLSHLSSQTTLTPSSNTQPSPPCLRRHCRVFVFRLSLIPPRAAASLSTSSEMSSSSTPLRPEQYHKEKGKTLLEFVGSGGSHVGDDLAVLIAHMQTACKRIAALVASPFDHENEIILAFLKSSGKVAAMASEEDEYPVWISDEGPFVVVTDPLDGSRNIDASIPTGTICGVYHRLEEIDHLPTKEKAQLNSLQSGARLIAAVYMLYLSATILCASFGPGKGTHVFHSGPVNWGICSDTSRYKSSSEGFNTTGQIYSVNDARYFDWPESLRQYIDTVRQGKGQTGKKYSARYICSLVAGLHRTLLYGSIAMNPRDHLRLVYEANPKFLS